VHQTNHIRFDKNVKTFSLIAGDSLYAFCISPELTLEHLYWGKNIRNDFDLRYLSQSCRMSHFNTVEVAAANFDGRIVLEAETLEEVQKSWKMNRSVSSDDDGYFQKRRLENYSWRILSKAMMSQKPNETTSRLKSHSVTFDVPSKSEIPSIEVGGEAAGSIQSRFRSASNPVANASFTMGGESKFSFNQDTLNEFMQLNAMTKFVQSDSPVPAKSLESLVGQRGQIRHHANKQTFDRQLGKIGKGLLCSEYADHGTGDFRSPSFIVVDNLNGSSISPLKYKRHRIFQGKVPMPDNLPGIRCYDRSEASTLIVTLTDSGSGLEVDLVYVAMHNYDCITRRAVFRNSHTQSHSSSTSRSSSQRDYSKVVQKASSATIDFECPSDDFHMVQLSGTWARERNVLETKLFHGMHSFGSTRGVSSHHHCPFAAITIGLPSETKGEVKGFSFVYSGNFLVEAEVTEMGRLRFNMGIHPMGMQWYLKQKGEFNTPEVVMVRSSEGLGGMSRSFHRLFLDRLIPRNWSDDNPPVLLNSWEAKYFHVNHQNIVELARQSAKVGIDMIVLDDGWFGDRSDDKKGLGDWFVNLEKFPNGLKPMVDEINSLGLKFGIWIEPEMVSEQSMLFTSHPDWYLHVPFRPRQLGRNQMVLDLSRQDVRDYLFEVICSLLQSANIEYVKWDMNRPLTEVYSLAAGSEEVWQAEISHRYILGLYDLQRRITEAFPHILLENCASGGGRYDPGMLYYSPQVWSSDNTDALVRMKIQYGTSFIYPARTAGAHVSTVPNHLTGNVTRLRTRGFCAMSGTFGYELDIGVVTPAEMLIYQKQVEFYRMIAHIVRWGDLYRLWNPFKMPFAAWMYVTLDKSEAVVFVFSMNSDHWSNIVPRLMLQGLDPDTEYEITEPAPNNLTQSNGNYLIIETEVPVYQLGVSSVVLTGDILMNAGLPVRFYSLDDSVVFVLRKSLGIASPASVVSRNNYSSPGAFGLPHIAT